MTPSPAASAEPAAALVPPAPVAANQGRGGSFRHRFEGPFFRRLFVLGVRCMPGWLRFVTMPLWAALFFLLVPSARRGVAGNLDAADGPRAGLARLRRTYRLFLNYAQTLTDTYVMHAGGQPVPAEPMDQRQILTALGEGKGAIIATAHLGMWQFGPFLAKSEQPHQLPTFYMAMAAEPNPLVQQFEERFRSSFRIIYTTESPFSGLAIRRALQEQAMVGMQLDRSPGGMIPVPFLGRTAYFSPGPALLSRLTGAPLMPLFFLFEPDPRGRGRRVVIYSEPPIEVPHTRDRDADIHAATARLAAVYERYVRRYPTQWYNFHDFFAVPQKEQTLAASRRSPGGKAPLAEGAA